jgi:hypothetical protein
MLLSTIVRSKFLLRLIHCVSAFAIEIAWGLSSASNSRCLVLWRQWQKLRNVALRTHQSQILDVARTNLDKSIIWRIFVDTASSLNHKRRTQTDASSTKSIKEQEDLLTLGGGADTFMDRVNTAILFKWARDVDLGISTLDALQVLTPLMRQKFPASVMRLGH